MLHWSTSLDGSLQGPVVLSVVLLLVGSTVAVVDRFVPVPYESLLALFGVVVGFTTGSDGCRPSAAT